MKTQHTPTPWTMIKHGTPEYSPQFGIYAEAEGQPTDLAIVCHTDNAEANAAFIVRACNCHEELLEACKTALPLLAKLLEASQGIDGIVDSRLNLEYDIEQVQAAIAKAQE